MSLHQSLLDALDARLPASAFLDFVDAGLPSFVPDPMLPSLAMRLAVHHEAQTMELAEQWAVVMTRVLQGVPVDDRDVPRILREAVLEQEQDPVVMAVWNMLHERLTSGQKIETLRSALRKGWPRVVTSILNSGVSADLRQVRNHHNPFNAFRSLDDLKLLMEHGFDPWQPDQGARTGHEALRRRPPTAFRRVRADGRWTTRGAKAEVMRHLHAQDHRPLPQQVTEAIVNAQNWNDLEQMIAVIGPAWLDQPSLGAGTVLHTLAVHHPQWMGHALERRDVRAREPVWTVRPDEAGRHPWELVWLNHQAAGPWGMAAGSVWNLEADLRASDAGAAWLAAIPHRPGACGLDQQIDAAILWKRSLPSFNHPTWWAWMQEHGGQTAQQAWHDTRDEPRRQERLDHLVWDVLAQETMAYADQWFNLDLWSEDPHPWLATYRLLGSMVALIPTAETDTGAGSQHRYHLERAVQAIGQGADWERVQGWIEAGKLRQGDDQRQVWHRELLTAWEARALRSVGDPTTAVQIPRRRL